MRSQGDVLAAVDATTNVRVRGGVVELENGPRVETTAPASGFNLLECADLDEAIEVSAKHPIARYGVIELRPITEGSVPQLAWREPTRVAAAERWLNGGRA